MNRFFFLTGCVALTSSVFAVNPDSFNLDEKGWDPDTTFPIPTPEEAAQRIEVPKGYHLEVVASEPMVEEPASIAFGPDGELYVCEWRTYMQDEYATDQLAPVSRVVKLVDTDGDGQMDQRTVFIDNVLLPRTVLLLGDRVLVNLTNSNTIYAYFDDDRDGVADRREVAYEGDENKGNIEHQSSGLVFNLDNQIYTNYARMGYHQGKLTPTPHSVARISQWGLARDDDGRMYCSWAGGGDPASSFQFPGGYPLVKIDEHGPDYDTPYASCKVWDQSSGGYNEEKQVVLTKFSAACGQTVLRSPLMPEWYGNLVTCEPVGRFLRMTEVQWEKGKGTAHNAFPGSEFIRSADPYFRPVWAESGPDGCLYIADMSRGIIQEKNWFPTEDGDERVAWVNRYKRVKKWGMLKAFRHGRIYRLVPDDKQPGPLPSMSDEDGTALAEHLTSDNGWWRDTAQKLIVTGEHQDAVPALKELASAARTADAQITALWSLEGLGALDRELVLSALQSPEPRVRTAAIHLSEAFLEKGDAVVREALVAKLDESDPKTAMQLYLSFNAKTDKDYATIRGQIQALSADHPLVAALNARQERLADEGRMSRSAVAGRNVYESLCTTCHGANGEGASDGTKQLAPAPKGNHWFADGGRIDIIARVLLKGQMGPIQGRTYGEGIMIPLETVYDDRALANVINFIGEKWNQWDKGVAKPGDVAKVREAETSRLTPWTEAELEALAKKH